MKEILTVEMNLDEHLNLKIYYWDEETSDVEVIDYKNYKEYVEKLGCTPELLETLLTFRGSVNEAFVAIKADMTELYKEIRELKRQINLTT